MRIRFTVHGNTVEEMKKAAGVIIDGLYPEERPPLKIDYAVYRKERPRNGEPLWDAMVTVDTIFLEGF